MNPLDVYENCLSLSQVNLTQSEPKNAYKMKNTKLIYSERVK